MRKRCDTLDNLYSTRPYLTLPKFNLAALAFCDCINSYAYVAISDRKNILSRSECCSCNLERLLEVVVHIKLS